MCRPNRAKWFIIAFAIIIACNQGHSSHATTTQAMYKIIRLDLRPQLAQLKAPTPTRPAQ